MICCHGFPGALVPRLVSLLLFPCFSYMPGDLKKSKVNVFPVSLTMSQKKNYPPWRGKGIYRLRVSPVFPKAQMCSCYIVISPDTVIGSVPVDRLVETCMANMT